MANRKQLFEKAESWFESQGWQPFAFQKETWTAFLQGKHGLLNAPTGSGKTYALWVPIMLDYLKRNPDFTKHKPGLKAIWITPLRALSVEIKQAAERLVEGLGVPFEVAIRSGDTTSAERAKQSKKMPDLLITTPESLQLLLASKDYPNTFKNCSAIVVDEWHELLGTKRGVQMELALSRLKTIAPNLRIWGISATIGNLEQARQVLLGPDSEAYENSVLVKAVLHKKTNVISIIPTKMESYPWRGHMGFHLIDDVARIVKESRTTLIFTNVRSACELWYQRLLDKYPEFAGEIAMHHGSIDRDVRIWVENAIRDEKLKAVVCTSSLDLGVDFAPVETIIQIGGPKGVARFMQRAGRSNHKPGKESLIYFLATHAIELVEASALKKAVEKNVVEDRIPYLNSWDVLIQYLNTLAVSDGFFPDGIFEEVKSTFCYQAMTREDYQWCLNFIVHGSQSLHAYDEYKKVEIEADGRYKINKRSIATQHRMSIGTIVSDAVMQVKFFSGGFIGSIEEWFISKLKPGDVFQFAGRQLELYRIKNMQVLVKSATRKPTRFASWMGGRLALSAQMSELLRQELYSANHGKKSPELHAMEPIFKRQRKESIVPEADQFLIETFKTREGYHAIFYPFEGRFVHEALASLLAYRISLLEPITFSLAYNDYGFELLSDKEIDMQSVIDNDLFTPRFVHQDLQKSLNATEMARRKFRDISVIAGMVFSGYPGKTVKAKHLQSSTQLLFEVFRDYEPDNLLLQQAYRETFEHQLEEGRLIQSLERIASQEIVWKQCKKPTPFSFPIITDRLREKLSSETLAERIAKMTASYMKGTA
ncbi:ligase-associated DNA damage response DEXH box helicase [Flavobacterium sp. MAH-1]|uniref:Ligase-associated DNA damage response DEXH box helicase n=1 Tax=Flavobacterium agri TaxID=2743471 RepID=A0A7Y8XZC5_9FLAO|nr:ligase-associated DNA damage response DEXH box helicase [Flavobacterium agri]NUY79491.1 ligase-associated DNA damage response DEXH box helicase [Flavobacterium agri]NYA69516.1 ligase-associated DNA damage response DEXH box helicase [Flavobacterium agri]